jgi:hypothetical protein
MMVVCELQNQPKLRLRYFATAKGVAPTVLANWLGQSAILGVQ